MQKLKVIWLNDSTDCDTCGPSYAQGFRAYLDDELLDEFVPHASCFGGDHIEDDDIWIRLFKHFDIAVETEYE